MDKAELATKLIEMLCDEGSPRPEPTEALRIVVLQRGWVVVGNVSRNGDEVLVRDASVIRTWGTSKGLGEIAAGGPTGTTVLDPYGTLRTHVLCVIQQIDCDAKQWEDSL